MSDGPPRIAPSGRVGERVARGITVLCGLLLMNAQRASAQERLVGSRVAGAGVAFETVRFSGLGLPQTAFAGLDSTRLRSAQQFTLPVTAATPIGTRWRLDVTSLFSRGTVTYADPSAPRGERTATLSGLSDVRLRLSGRVIGDGLLLTIGLNAPTGRTRLSTQEFSTLRVLASPALGLGSTSVGSGPSGTVGVVLPQVVGAWSMAYGTSYEFRGRYQPIAALTAGAPSADFTPGGVVRASVSADRSVGPHRLIVAMAADVFTEDRLRSDVPPDAAGHGGGPSVASVRLGPVFSADAQMQLAAPGVRELLTYAAYRWRAPFARDGVTVGSSSGQYLDAGVRAVRSLGVGRDLVASADARWHSGLGVDLGLPTAGVTSGTVSLGVNIRRSLFAVQPYLRAQGGSLVQRAVRGSSPRHGFSGAALGLVITTRF